jgi:hypothetical protein
VGHRHRLAGSTSHDYAYDFASLQSRLGRAGFDGRDTSVSVHSRFHNKPEWWLRREIGRRIYQADADLVFGNRAIINSDWCVWELEKAVEHDKPILVVVPTGYAGGVPPQVRRLDTLGGPVRNADAVIRRLRSHFEWR